MFYTGSHPARKAPLPNPLPQGGEGRVRGNQSVERRRAALTRRRVFLLRACIVMALAAGASWSGAGEKDAAGARSGRFSLLTYNVAGLPEPLSGSEPVRNTPLISPRLNAFDIVVTQEDFWYGKKLRRDSDHPYYAPRGRSLTLGDGLSRFSRLPFAEVVREDWKSCHGYLNHGSDCMTAKGFAYAAHELAPGVFLDIYDLHMDAGHEAGDLEARTEEVDQLLAALRARSAGKAVIVAGDWNLSSNRPRDLENLDRMLAAENLGDACLTLHCGVERVDRILFRESDSLKLRVVDYQVETERFADEAGRQLSDHHAVSAVFEWESLGNQGLIRQ